MGFEDFSGKKDSTEGSTEMTIDGLLGCACAIGGPIAIAATLSREVWPYGVGVGSFGMFYMIATLGGRMPYSPAIRVFEKFELGRKINDIISPETVKVLRTARAEYTRHPYTKF